MKACAVAMLLLALAACTKQRDPRAVVGVDRDGHPIYANAQQQAEFDQQREDRALLKSVADGQRSVDSLSPQERATVRAAVKPK